MDLYLGLHCLQKYPFSGSPSTKGETSGTLYTLMFNSIKDVVLKQFIAYLSDCRSFFQTYSIIVASSM